MADKTAGRARSKGTGSIVKKNNRFFLKVVIAGKAKSSLLRYDNGLPVTSRIDAEKAAKGLQKILAAETKEDISRYISEAKKLKKRSHLAIAYAWKVFLDLPDRKQFATGTLKNHEGIFNLFVSWIEKNHPKIKLVCDVDCDLAASYMQYIWKSGVSKKRYNDTLISLRMFFRSLMKHAWLDENPFDQLELLEGKETINRKEFTQEQIAAIFQGFDEGFFYDAEMEQLTEGRKRQRITKRLEFKPMNAIEMKVLLSLCCWTGCRGQDACLMTWDNINLDSNKIIFIPRKTAKKSNRKPVSLPIHPDLFAGLNLALAWRKDNVPGENYVLPAIAKRYKANPSGIQKDVMKIIHCATGLDTKTENKYETQRKLAVNQYSLHSFRHSFVSFCANNGIPLETVADIVGHDNPVTTRIYSHITDKSKEDAINKLPSIRPFKLLPDVNEEPAIDITAIDTTQDRLSRITSALNTAAPGVLDEIEKILNLR